ncbi:LysR family transcriptional regulator [Pseudoflavitalea sp. G-6-1-2]|uniref:LysR family transcriptional regulator n=1 Tax=Pseudoflavitalea sp. G-6-1-2 TaxID=2728841 RepID=UPI00146D4E95|nr:LysR family transcriptional regulator [Pseudoflavitalea sp. G-6-1-2]NML21431.1 LysR family transcriptional regulator [Pseudoflavitalea sp. G-6-1-2]
MINSSDLLLVQRIVEMGSITKAADSLYLTQSAISHQLRELELRAGMQLFERVNKKLLLTHAGRRVMESACNILPQLSRLSDDLHSLKYGHPPALRISTECYTCYHWLPEIITKLRKKSDGADISIVAAATQRPIDFLLNGELDLAIISEVPGQSGINSTPLFTDNLVAVVNKHHPLAKHRSLVTANDFANEHMITYDSRETSNVFAKEFFREVQPKKTTRVQLTEAIVEMINANMGISIFATWVIEPYLKNRDLITLPIKSSFKKRTWRAAWLGKPHPLLPDFTEAVKAQFK